MIFFPLLCKLLKGKKHHRYTKVPEKYFRFYEDDLKGLPLVSKKRKMNWCALLFCVLFNTELTDDKIMSVDSESCLKDAVENCFLATSESRENIKFALKHLNEEYTCFTEGRYRIIHDKLFDLCAKYFGEKMTLLFIKYADSDIIMERFVWDSNETRMMTLKTIAYNLKMITLLSTLND